MSIASEYIAAKIVDKMVQKGQNQLAGQLFKYLLFDKHLDENYRMNLAFEMFCHSLLCKGLKVSQKIKYRTGQLTKPIAVDLPRLESCGEVRNAADLIDKVNKLDLQEKEAYFKTIKDHPSIDSLSIKFDDEKNPIHVKIEKDLYVDIFLSNFRDI